LLVGDGGCIGALYIWLGSYTTIHLTTPTITVGGRCYPQVTVTTGDPLSHHCLRLVPFWVTHFNFLTHVCTNICKIKIMIF